MHLLLKPLRRYVCAALTLAALAAAPAVADETAAETKLEDLVGNWLILVELPEGAQTAHIAVEGDADGLTAVLTSPLGESNIDDIELDNGEHVMIYMMDLGGQPLDIEVTARVNGDLLAGTILVGGGAMELNFEGAREGTEAAAELEARAAEALAQAAAAAAAASTEEPASQPASQPSSASVPPSDRAVAEFAADDTKVSIDYGRPSTQGPGYQQMAQGVPEGYVWRLGKNQATRLETNANLKFGETVIEAGEYGLWARRVGDRWDLLFNSNARVWGVPYRADGEIASVPMKASTIEAAAELLTITIEPAENGGVIHVHWGNDLGTVAFELAD
jgi:hypothetical protein